MRDSMKQLPVALICLLIIFLLYYFCFKPKDTHLAEDKAALKSVKVDAHDDRIAMHFTYNGHDYIKFIETDESVGEPISIVHDPDCKKCDEDK